MKRGSVDDDGGGFSERIKPDGTGGLNFRIRTGSGLTEDRPIHCPAAVAEEVYDDHGIGNADLPGDETDAPSRTNSSGDADLSGPADRGEQGA